MLGILCVKQKGSLRMMACQGNECVWISLMVFMMVYLQVHVTDGRENFILKQPNVTVSNYGFNSVNVSWEAEELVEKEHLNVCYIFSYRFLDKKKWLKLTKKYYTIKLRMHPSLVGSVSSALCISDLVQFQSKPAEFVYNAPQVYINNVSCVLFNITNLNCSWIFRTDAPDDSNYSFALRLSLKWLACTHYFTIHKRNVGCYMQDVFSDYKDDNSLTRIRIGFFSDLYNFSKTFRPEAIEILTPPRNILLLSENGNTIIKWLPPASVAINGVQDGMTSTSDAEEEDNFLYEIRVIENKSKRLFRQPNKIEKEEQTFTDLAKDKKYYMQIRARHRCGFCKTWGEWSTPVFIGKDKDIFPEWIFIVIVPALFAILGLYLCKRYMKILFAIPIPHPSKNIKNWLYMDGSNDMRPQANIAANEQSVPLTEIEIVTTTLERNEKP